MNKKLIIESDIIKLERSASKILYIDKGAVITPSALDRIRHAKIEIVYGDEKQKDEHPVSITAGNISKIAIGGDHTGFDIKEILKKYIKDKKYEVIDCGAFDKNSCDYPDFAAEVSKKVVLREACVGILIDATGIPSAITANKFPGIRAATCYNEFSAFSSRSHNDANILVLGAKTLGEESIKSILNVWLKTEFEGGRHQRRLHKITDLEKSFLNKNK